MFRELDNNYTTREARMKRLVLFTLALLCVVSIFHMAMGQVAKKKAVQDSRYLQYEGVLTDPSGARMTGEYTVTFTIYDSPDAAVPQWVEVHNVYVNDGAFKVTLGKNTPLPSRDTENSQIGVSINGEELLPRQVVRSSRPVDDTSMRDFPKHREPFFLKDNDWDYWTNPPDMFTIPDGNVGVGITNPASKLHVEGSDTAEAVVIARNTEGGFGLRSECFGSSNTISPIGLFAGGEGPGPVSIGSMNAALNNGEGLAYGSFGLATSTGAGNAYGNYGIAGTAGEGSAYGVVAHGAANNSSGVGYGVSSLGENAGSGLAVGGLFNTVSTGTGAHYGVQAFGFGESSSPTVGMHAYGQNTSDGDVYGGYFDVFGWGTGHHYGLHSFCSGSNTLHTYGVFSEAENTGNGGVTAGHFQTSSNGTALNVGVSGGAYITASSEDSRGVSGFAGNGGEGDCYGGHFSAYSLGDSRAYGSRSFASGDSWKGGVGADNYAYHEGAGTTYGTYSVAECPGPALAVGGYFSPYFMGEGIKIGVEAFGDGTCDYENIGVLGSATNFGSGGASGGKFSATTNGTGPNYGVYASEYTGGSGAAVYAAGDMIASGAKPAVVKTSSGHRLLYAQESPEVWFEDFGEGQLSNGRTHIELDQLFLETVTIDENHPMKVFVQLEGDCRGTFVNKNDTGFDVLELQSGTSNAAFSYRVVAKRKGYEDERLRITDVGYEDPTLYPELLTEIERKVEERLQQSQKGSQERKLQRQQLMAERQQMEEDDQHRRENRQRMEEERQQIQEEQRRMEQARLEGVIR